MDFAVTADHSVKLNKSEKMDKYLDNDGEFLKKWNMKVTIKPNLIGAP